MHISNKRNNKSMMKNNNKTIHSNWFEKGFS